MAKYTRITYNERAQIKQFLEEGVSFSEIAEKLGRSKSTISAEVRRKQMNRDRYNPKVAQADCNFKRKLTCRKKKIFGALEQLILFLLVERRFSPEQISNFLKIKHPNMKYLNISTEAIYQYVYTSPIRKQLTRYLRKRHMKRRPKKKSGIKRGGIRNKVSIHQRPRSIENMEVAGHWEGDLIIGKGQQSAIGTLVERSTRYTLIVPVKSRKSEDVTTAFLDKLKGIPANLKKSLTYDQGSEMAQHEKFTRESGMTVYFADQGKLWQRGTNENAMEKLASLLKGR